jgi:hypothetical protein
MTTELERLCLSPSRVVTRSCKQMPNAKYQAFVHATRRARRAGAGSLCLTRIYWSFLSSRDQKSAMGGYEEWLVRSVQSEIGMRIDGTMRADVSASLRLSSH